MTCSAPGRAALAAALLLAHPASHAGKLMDYIRNYDLNDYSLGVAFSTSQNPYAGSRASRIVYPYLTSFEHSAFTDNWLLIRGENMGLRVPVGGDWELGLIGRVQTLGQGVAASDELAGIEERSWVLETGPLVGFRGWPVHMQFRSYWEVPNRHSGTTSELEFSLPVKHAHGFFVPAVKLSYLSSDYNAYYFGVSEREASAGRPAYRPGSATNVWAGLTLGYAVAPRWLLKTTIGFEHLDTTIADSPVTDRDRLWSGSVGLAYNADLFNPRDHPSTRGQRPVEIRLGAFSSSADTTVRKDPENGVPGQQIDLEDLVGAADSRTVLLVDTRLRLGYFHRFQLSYFEIDRTSTKTLSRDVGFGDEFYPAGTEVETNIDSSLLRLSYLYSLMRDGQKEVGVSAGLSFFDFETEIRPSGTAQAEALSAAAPLPTLGVFGSAGFGSNWKLSAEASVFALDFDRYDGLMAYLSVGLERHFGESFSAGLGYDFLSLGLEAEDEDLAGEFDLVYHGPRLFVGLAF